LPVACSSILTLIPSTFLFLLSLSLSSLIMCNDYDGLNTVMWIQYVTMTCISKFPFLHTEMD
jgi:hypothetical protein